MHNLTTLLSQLNNISSAPLIEGKAHLDHPEDMVFLHSDGARAALIAIINTVKHPESVTLKFDGYPAIIFGRGINNKFSIVDKHMFDRKDGSGKEIYSVEDFIEYDNNRGVDRNELHVLLSQIWNPLKEATANSSGYYWGDVLFRNKLTPVDGLYKFRANPNGISYTVKVDSDIGRLISGKIGGIAVHQQLGETAVSTDYAVSLSGTLGNLIQPDTVAIIPSAIPVKLNLTLDKKLLSAVTTTIKTYASTVDSMFNNPPISKNTFSQLFTIFINKKIMSGDLQNIRHDFDEYIINRKMTDSSRLRIINYLKNNSSGIEGAFSIWIALFNLKNDIISQIDIATSDAPIVGYLNNGQQSGEGYVSQGIKLVNRMGFSRQNLLGN